MPVYVFQEGDSPFFKVGRTKHRSEEVMPRLRTGNPRPLRLFAEVETNDEKTCEAFFHRMLGSRRVNLGGGTEFFEIAPAEMAFTVEKLRRMFSELESARASVHALVSETSQDTELEPGPEDHATLQRLHLLRMRTNALQVEIELLELRLKQRIGTASGIRGVATWKTSLTRRYSEEFFRQRDPNLFEHVIERFHCIDTARWRREDYSLYRSVQTTHYRPLRSRLFRLTGNANA